jgi:putative sterol carrier protein
VNRYPFLSEEWFTEVRRLHDAYDDAVPAAAAIRMNLMIKETPFGGDLPMHMTAEGGQADWDEGHLDDADVTLILGYETAREIFVGGNPQAAIEAFMAGKITMQGDITKLMEMQMAQPGPRAPELARAMQEITE